MKLCDEWGHSPTEIVVDNQEAQVEICKACGKKLVYRKHRETGRIDNEQYMRDHLRDFLQPSDPEYARFYDMKKRREERLNHKKVKDDMQREEDEGRERLDYERKRSTFSTGKTLF